MPNDPLRERAERIHDDAQGIRSGTLPDRLQLAVDELLTTLDEILTGEPLLLAQATLAIAEKQPCRRQIEHGSAVCICSIDPDLDGRLEFWCARCLAARALQHVRTTRK